MHSCTKMHLVPHTALTELGDDDLMTLARDGSRDAFRVLVRRHEAKAVAFGTRYLGSSLQAKDAAQEAFVELYLALGRYQPRGHFLSYWHQILLNQCRMVVRSGATRRAVYAQLETVAASAAPTADELLSALQDQKAVTRALDTLSEKLRVVVALRFGAGLPLQEVAETLDLPLGTVKSRLFAALADLKAALKGTA
ncbi:MAG: RNA polymerase sigma factor [Archangium sp.]